MKVEIENYVVKANSMSSIIDFNFLELSVADKIRFANNVSLKMIKSRDLFISKDIYFFELESTLTDIQKLNKLLNDINFRESVIYKKEPIIEKN